MQTIRTAGILTCALLWFPSTLLVAEFPPGIQSVGGKPLDSEFRDRAATQIDAQTPSGTRNAVYDSLANEAAVEQIQFRGFAPRSARSVFARQPTRPNELRSPAVPRRMTARAPMTSRRRRLARAPDMLGDTFQTPLLLTLAPQLPTGLSATTQLAVAGGNSRIKISEHNKALPVDRVYLNYNHIRNAVQRQVSDSMGNQVLQSDHLNRFTLGTERTLFNGDASIELRLPFSSYPDLNAALPQLGLAGQFTSVTGTIGNLSLIGKRLLINEEDLVVSCGLGIEFPTGADAAAVTATTLFNVENESLHLQLFAAATLDNGEVFIHSFLQVDIDVKGSPLTISDTAVAGPPVGVGEIAGRTLLHWDTAAGVWLLQSDHRTGLTGLAAIAEFHLTSATSSGGQAAGTVPTAGGLVDFQAGFTQAADSASYITTGLHSEFGQNRTLRVAAVFPLRDRSVRLFDAEFVLQIGTRY